MWPSKPLFYFHESLQVSGNVTYNGHGFKEFVPQRTSAYVHQYDEVLLMFYILHGQTAISQEVPSQARLQLSGRLNLLQSVSAKFWSSSNIHKS